MRGRFCGVPAGRRTGACRPGTAKHFGTVGAVALDQKGHLAAGTATGGMTNKRYGGRFAEHRRGQLRQRGLRGFGIGWGKFYIRAAAAHDICACMACLKESPQQAGKAVINQAIPRLGGDGGRSLGADGAIGMPFNTEAMYRDWIAPRAYRT